MTDWNFHSCIECGYPDHVNRKFNEIGPFCKDHQTYEMAEKHLKLRQKTVAIIAASGLGLILLMFLLLISSFLLYSYQWKRRPDYREKYSSFSQFYNNHLPGDLFKEPEQKESANKPNSADAKNCAAD